MINKVFLLTFLFSFTVWANDPTCKLTSFKNIVKINKIQDDTIVQESDCSAEVIEDFKLLIENANGLLKASFLSQYFQQEHGTHIQVSPDTIQVSDIKDHIQKSIGDENLIIKKVNSLIPHSSLTYNTSETLRISCKNCDSPGTKDLALTLGKKKHWLSANIFIKKEVYSLEKNIINLSEKLSPDHFKKVTIIDRGNKRYFDDLSNIKFYRLNKFMRKGDVLGAHDVSPKSIVKYGDKVKVKINNSSVNLSVVAIAKSNGRFGDIIELQNPKSNKKITAKITDYNQAEINL
ncbi:MAG: flagella basal body P-ring formation protein FlgA [Halobacteriovoraceae bacterium]|nr:flagella basal body P-ring formation protein FlgA [Halobacteriovoraceae bacterium]|tara:strand:+ start:7217 stop:8089 length:873 start_codon:yes stop_codon:yes gene_type:complete